MGRLAVGTVAVANRATNGNPVRDVQAEAGQWPGNFAPRSSSAAVVSGPRSERVLSLVLALEALREVPQVLSAGRR